MSIRTICAAIANIASINKASLGIETVVDPPPPTLDSAKLPLLYTWTGPAQYAPIANDLWSETRVYRVQVAVMPQGEASPQLREERSRPIITATRDVFFKYPGLNQTAGVQDAHPLGDSGVVLLPEWGQKYIGFEIRLQVVEYFHRLYEEGE